MRTATLEIVKQAWSFATFVGEEPPTEFRIFRAGENPSTKGVVLFDADAARTVIAAWERWGNDLMIDLEHQSLDANASSREDAPDARGWCRLEVRDGELWAVDVRWNPDGERRIRERRQRYVSPTFFYDDDGRVLEIVNIALCAMPATHDAQPLIAATRVANWRKTGGRFAALARAAILTRKARRKAKNGSR